MNFDDALKRYAPQAWFRFKFFKYKYLKRGEPELWLIRYLVAPDSTAVDIGASIGMYTHELSRYARKVMAFEANPAVAALTRRGAARNVEVLNIALSSRAGRTALKIPRNAGGAAIEELGTIEPGNPLHASDSDTLQIETKRLDELGITNCSFIKIDVEGHEEAVLEGASDLIAAQRPVLMAELDEILNPGSVDRFAANLVAQRYRGFFLSRKKLHPIESFEPAVHQDQALLVYSRKSLPADREYINNFVFLPDEKSASILTQIALNHR